MHRIKKHLNKKNLANRVLESISIDDTTPKADLRKEINKRIDGLDLENMGLTPLLKKHIYTDAREKKFHEITFSDGRKVKSQQGMTEAYAKEISKIPSGQYCRIDPQAPADCMRSQLALRDKTLRIGSFWVSGINPVAPHAHTLLIVGTATGWDRDLKKAEALCKEAGVSSERMCLNGAGVTVPGRFWYSIHGGYIAAWEEYVKTGKHLICEFLVPGVHSCYGFFNDDLNRLKSVGYSGNFAVLTAMVMGYHRVIMCGMPLDKRPVDPCFDNHAGLPLDVDTWKKHNKIQSIQLGWVYLWKKFPELQERVRSLSGYTSVVTDKPTVGWLNYKGMIDEQEKRFKEIKAEILERESNSTGGNSQESKEVQSAGRSTPQRS